MPWIEDKGVWGWYSKQSDLRLLLWADSTNPIFWGCTIHLAPCCDNYPGINTRIAANNLVEAQRLLLSNYRGMLEECALRRTEVDADADNVVPPREKQKTVWDHLVEEE